MKAKNSKVAALKIVRYKVDYLMSRIADYNPRVIGEEEEEGLAHSIKTFGYLGGMVFNKRTQTVVSGHQRIEQLSNQGYDEVDVNEIDVSLEVEKQINVTMNNRKIQGDFTHALSDLLNEISEVNPELFDLTNMSSLDFDDMFDDEEEFEDLLKEPEEEKGLEVMPYENYDCILVVFKRKEDYEIAGRKFGLEKKRVVSSPTSKKKKVGQVRAIEGSKLIKALKGNSFDIDI